MSRRRREPGSPVFAAARDQWRAIRQEYQLVLEATYARAEHDTAGVLLNRAGKEAHVDAMSLFMGPYQRVRKYASEELVEWFATNGRTTYADFERQYVEDLWADAAADHETEEHAA